MNKTDSIKFILGYAPFDIIYCMAGTVPKTLTDRNACPCVEYLKRREGGPLTQLNNKVMYGLWKLPKSFEDDIVSLFAANTLELTLRPG